MFRKEKQCFTDESLLRLRT